MGLKTEASFAMKDISDYFLSPTKTSSTTGSKTSLTLATHLPNPKNSYAEDKKTNNEKKTRDPEKLSLSIKKSKKSSINSMSNVENNERTSQKKTKEKSKKNSKLQLKLKTFTSSSNSDLSQSSSQDIEIPIKKDNSCETTTKSARQTIDSQNVDLTSSTRKVNAFQFLMDSRNNIIGQNSDGKDADDTSPSLKAEKEKISKHKNFLEGWAEKKGAAKRKREELEIEKCINRKLEKRAKRLKNMLQGESSVDEVTNLVIKKKKKVLRIDSSESEESKSSVKEEVIEISVSKRNSDKNCIIIDDETAQDRILNIQVKDQNKNDKKARKRKDFKGLLSVNQDLTNHEVPRTLSKKKNKLSESVDDSSQESQDKTARLHRKWMLKIKLNENTDSTKEGEKNEEKTYSNSIVEVVDELSKVNNINHKHDKPLNITIPSSDSEDEKPLSKIIKNTKKVAPIFSKAKKLDAKTLEARNNFLMSGVPEKLKKTLEKQTSLEERPHNVFPAISHVQQKCDNQFWALPKINLDLKNMEDTIIESTNLVCEKVTKKELNIKLMNFSKAVKKVKNIKGTLDQIKQDNPEYPVYKAFKQLYNKNGKTECNSQAKVSKKRKKSLKTHVELTEVEKELVTKGYEVWTEKYKARCSEEILGNHSAVTKLKKWLETWMNYSEKINSKRRAKTGYDSASEFDTTDCESQDLLGLPGNTIIVGGPYGSGKTSAIYAITNEFGYNVLEVNASSKRTGKKLQQELQEATQSHQVRKKGITTIFNINKPKSEIAKKPDTINGQSVENEKKKMCILLIEDIDVIFEQDDGFMSSLSQLILTSKRPIILTTSDTGSYQIQKLISQHDYISFTPLSLNTLAVWLQLLCLVEGLLVSQKDLGNLLEYNRGDIRKTLLEVQFWVQSGGQINSEETLPILTNDSSRNWEKKLINDEELNMFLNEKSDTTTKNFTHKNILGSFEIFKGNELYNIPLNISLGTLWWNVPNIFKVNIPKRRLNIKAEADLPCKNKITDFSDKNKSNKLTKALIFYESLATMDIIHTSLGHSSSMEPIINDWTVEIKDSLELDERMDEQNCLDFVGEMSHFMIDTSVDLFRKSGAFSGVNMALPNSAERRWRAKQHICEDFLKEPIPLSYHLERRNVALDYLSSLRNIARSEKTRSAVNTKRRNRFRHYFRNLNMNFDDSVCKMVSNTFVVDSV